MPDEAPVELNLGSIVGKKYKITQKLGEGGCGSVYKVEDIQDPNLQQYALKVEYNSANAGNVLKMEVQILTLMTAKKHVAKCIASGKKEKYSYLVMTLLGDSLESLVRKDKFGFFNVSTQVRIAICVLFGIKQIHDIGYIHRDLKPANVALGHKGSPEERIFMVLDFGLARQYVTDEQDGRKMRRPREKALFRGTARYCSVAMHDRYEQSRVDDLWMWIYMLAELRASLPWEKLDDKVQIGEMKRLVPDHELFSKSPVQMMEISKLIRNTTFYERPDYEKMFKILEDTMKNANYKWSDPYHFEMKQKLLPFLGGGSKNKKSTTPTKEEMAAEKDAPFFTIDDFKSNPIGF